MTTMVYLVIDPATESLELVNAGHPPALVVDPSGEAHFLWPNGGVPLGATAAATYEAERFPLPTGATVLIYTDGLVERRGESIEVGLERLREIAKGARDPESLCVTICERLVPEEPEDDVAFIAIRVPPLGDHVTTTWRVSPDSLAPIRYLLRRWLMNRGASERARPTTSSSPPRRRARTPSSTPTARARASSRSTCAGRTAGSRSR